MQQSVCTMYSLWTRRIDINPKTWHCCCVWNVTCRGRQVLPWELHSWECGLGSHISSSPDQDGVEDYVSMMMIMTMMVMIMMMMINIVEDNEEPPPPAQELLPPWPCSPNDSPKQWSSSSNSCSYLWRRWYWWRWWFEGEDDDYRQSNGWLVLVSVAVLNFSPLSTRWSWSSKQWLWWLWGAVNVTNHWNSKVWWYAHYMRKYI